MRKITMLIVILFASGLQSSWAQDTWTQKADYGGGQRTGSVGFSIGNKGYIGCGLHLLVSYYNDFWEYDPDTNTWTQKANFPGAVRHGSVGFSVDGKGYVGTGTNTGQYFKDFWEYDPSANNWTKKADFAGSGRYGGVGFSIGGKGYIGTGISNDYYIGSTPIHYKDFWEYDPGNDAWIQKADFGGPARSGATGFSIGSKGYIGTGASTYGKKDFWEYDSDNDTWIQKADFGGRKRGRAVGFSIGSNGYIGTGTNKGINFNDFWRYNPDTNIWTRIADFEGIPRESAVGFSVGTKGYVGTGTVYPDCLKDFWEYSPHAMGLLNNPGSSAQAKFTAAPLKLKGLTGHEAYITDLYPNPVQYELTIKLTIPASEFTIHVYDLQGKMIPLTTILRGTEAHINTSAIPLGFYTLQITNNKTNASEVLKFLKQE